ncbi:MAG: hypothetical protein U0487_01195 [Patescibacteria group bacterium]
MDPKLDIASKRVWLRGLYLAYMEAGLKINHGREDTIGKLNLQLRFKAPEAGLPAFKIRTITDIDVLDDAQCAVLEKCFYIADTLTYVTYTRAQKPAA